MSVAQDFVVFTDKDKNLNDLMILIHNKPDKYGRNRSGSCWCSRILYSYETHDIKTYLKENINFVGKIIYEYNEDTLLDKVSKYESVYTYYSKYTYS